MGFFSKFENKMEDAIDDLGDKLFDSPISPVQIAKKAEKQMRRNKMVGAGKQYAPTLYTVLVNVNDDARLKGYYPTLAGETETYLKAKANEAGFAMDGDPLVRFMDDPDLKSGKFDIIAEAVSSEIISQLRAEEMERYGINAQQQAAAQAPAVAPSQAPAPVQQQAQPAQANVSSPFADYKSAPVAPAPQSVPAPTPSPAPQAVPVPQATPVEAAPVAPAPVAAPEQAVDPAPAAPAQVDTSLSNSPTAVFAGGFDVASNQAPGNVVPNAYLRNAITGQVYNLNQPTIVIGRESNCNIALQDANASRQHAQINYNNGLWIVNDLGSTNGTFVNNQEVTTREIHSGDIITIGVTNLTFNVG